MLQLLLRELLQQMQLLYLQVLLYVDIIFISASLFRYAGPTGGFPVNLRMLP